MEQAGGLPQRLMHDLSGRPRRFVELESLHGGLGTPALRETLERLVGDGLIAKRTSKRHVSVFHTFELTPLGARAEEEMQRLRPLQEDPDREPKRSHRGKRTAGTRPPAWVLPPRSPE
jgi:DNA-binding HxlR family transcriptional regulator